MIAPYKILYDNSLIVIASDHYAHLDMLRMNGRISNYTPLFIIHGDVEDMKSWKGEFHQIDTDTTLLDIMGICQPWLGLGYSILSSYPGEVLLAEGTKHRELKYV